MADRSKWISRAAMSLRARIATPPCLGSAGLGRDRQLQPGSGAAGSPQVSLKRARFLPVALRSQMRSRQGGGAGALGLLASIYAADVELDDAAREWEGTVGPCRGCCLAAAVSPSSGALVACGGGVRATRLGGRAGVEGGHEGLVQVVDGPGR